MEVESGGQTQFLDLLDNNNNNIQDTVYWKATYYIGFL